MFNFNFLKTKKMASPEMGHENDQKEKRINKKENPKDLLISNKKAENIKQLKKIQDKAESEEKQKADEKLEQELQNIWGKFELAEDDGLDACPYPDHKGYMAVRDKLSLWEKRQMKENIKITEDGKVEVAWMNKKFSVLEQYLFDNNRHIDDVYSWSDIDDYWKKWVSWITYLRWTSAEKIVKEQWKKMLDNDWDITMFIDKFPWKDQSRKIVNIAKIFWLEKSGIRDTFWNEWIWVGKQWYMTLSVINWFVKTTLFCNEWHWELEDRTWSSTNAQTFSDPVIIYEDINS